MTTKECVKHQRFCRFAEMLSERFHLYNITWDYKTERISWRQQ